MTLQTLSGFAPLCFSSLHGCRSGSTSGPSETTSLLPPCRPWILRTRNASVEARKVTGVGTRTTVHDAIPDRDEGTSRRRSCHPELREGLRAYGHLTAEITLVNRRLSIASDSSARCCVSLEFSPCHLPRRFPWRFLHVSWGSVLTMAGTDHWKPYPYTSTSPWYSRSSLPPPATPAYYDTGLISLAEPVGEVLALFVTVSDCQTVAPRTFNGQLLRAAKYRSPIQALG
ncbi:hypothetical protein NMY22_g3766 [Coprinellus aureogranulatus]|nr:hypothetical protein NMY22_g3766 [Coprinellus aureogranulatus]